MRFRFIASFVASIYILLHGYSLEVILRAFVTPSFYLALCISFPITLLLVFLVHRITIWLDKRHDWRTQLFERIIWQLIFAVVIPALIDLALISVYSAIIGENFQQSRFLLVDFPIIVAFIVLLNMYYVIRYLLLTEPAKNDNKKQKHFTIAYNGTFAEIDPETEIICFHRSVNLIEVLTIGRVYETRGESISDYENKFSDRGFIRINRSTIVNLNFVQGYAPGNKRDTVSILYKTIVDTSNFDPELFVVTDKYIESFKSHFSGNQE